MSWNAAWIGRALACLAVFANAAALVAADMHIFTMNLDGTDLRKIASVPGQQYLGSPRFSPDDSRVAFDASPAGFAANHLWLVDANGGDPADLGAGGLPHWSVDGKQLCYYLRDNNTAGEAGGIYVMAADGKGRQRLAGGIHGRWSPNGEKILYLNEDASHYYIYDLADDSTKTGNEESLGHIEGVAWSPDGKRVAMLIHSGGTGAMQLQIVESSGDGKLRERTLPHPLGYHRLGWAPGKKLLVTLHPEGATNSAIYMVEPDDETEPVAVPNGGEGTSNVDPAWSHDGKRIVFASSR